MKLISQIGLIALGAYVLTAPGNATTWYEVSVECPVGGKTFKTEEMGSNTYMGQRPDGRPYSPSPIPPIQECPDNGFVIFDDAFSNAELQKLEALIVSDDYRALSKSDNRHFRAWWLAEKIGRDAYDQAKLMLTASWDSDDDIARKKRYQSSFSELAKSLVFAEEKRSDWFWLRMRAGNALRELGLFDAASSLINATYLPSRLPKEAGERAGAKTLATGLRALNAEKNAASEPANLIPSFEAVDRCKQPDISATERKICSSGAIKKASKLRKAQSDF